MLPSKLYLRDRNPELAEAWRDELKAFAEISVQAGDFFEQEADAMVSPANSFGFMDGGLDMAIWNVLGDQIQQHVQEAIVARHHGELPVGSAEVVPTGHAKWRYLVVAPTMRVPEAVAHTANAYLAFRAALLAVRRFNETSADKIESLLVPGLATGIGAMSYRTCALQMRLAYEQVKQPARIPRPGVVLQTHQVLRKAIK